MIDFTSLYLKKNTVTVQSKEIAELEERIQRDERLHCEGTMMSRSLEFESSNSSRHRIEPYREETPRKSSSYYNSKEAYLQMVDMNAA
jgi:hypothetical protein